MIAVIALILAPGDRRRNADRPSAVTLAILYLPLWTGGLDDRLGSTTGPHSNKGWLPLAPVQGAEPAGKWRLPAATKPMIVNEWLLRVDSSRTPFVGEADFMFA